MNAPASTLTPAELVRQWTPKLRKIAFSTGADFDDVQQEAWLLAATMRPGDDLVPRWLKAVAVQAGTQTAEKIIVPKPLRKGEKTIGAGWLRADGIDKDTPEMLLVAKRRVSDLMSGDTLAQAIDMPVTTKEFSVVLKKCERQALRIRKKVDAIKEIQRDFFDFEPEEV